MASVNRPLGTWGWNLGAASAAVQAELAAWREQDKVRRLWAGDTSLWTRSDENRWLGWMRLLDGADGGSNAAAPLVQLASEVVAAGFRQVVVLGMGGSSLCPEVLSQTFAPAPGFPALLVLDSTDPQQVRSLEQRLDPAHTLFLVSSKSGTTTEPHVFYEYFFARVQEAVGAERAPGHFVAITDPGSKLQALAERLTFRRVVPGAPDIGGRYSALSPFGMCPAALMGLDVAAILRRAAHMARACGPEVPPETNPGVALGVALGTLARQGRDKLTFVASPHLASLGGWLEQLVAESTGKNGIGIVPVDGETLGKPFVYGDDRVFVATHLAEEAGGAEAAALQALADAGHPVVRITMQHPLDLGQEFFRWEIATAVAGSVLGLHPFDQPDVEAAKVATRALTAAYEKDGRLPEENLLLEEGSLRLFAAPAHARQLLAAAPSPGLDALLAAHLQLLRPGDYFALLAYLEMNAAHRRELLEMGRRVRDGKRVATTLGFGPRFLHSTGQLHKGGPNTGVFLQVTAESKADVPIPGRPYGFGLLESFQAGGDFAVLAERGRRVLRVHLSGDVGRSLARLRDLVHAAVPA